MLTIKAGEIAGRIWNALDEKGTLTGKELKKVCGRLTDKELYLGLGWLLREEKIVDCSLRRPLGHRRLFSCRTASWERWMWGAVGSRSTQVGRKWRRCFEKSGSFGRKSWAFAKKSTTF